MTAASPAKPMSGSFLDLLSDLDRSDLLSLGRPRTFRPGASIVVQGDHSDVVLVLLHGLVKVTLDTDDCHEIVLSVLIGEFEAVDHDRHPRTASNVALEAVETRVIASSRESIVRSLRSWRARRLVTTGRLRITIRDLDGLRREADGQ